MSTLTSSNGLGVTGDKSRVQIGREIPDNPASLAAAAPAKLTKDGGSFTATSQVTVGPIKPVDSKTLGGSYPGDHRVPAAPVNMDAFTNPGGPREQMSGQRDSKNYNEDGTAFKSTSNSPDSEAGN
jgi:hypothetical protein